MDDTRGNTNGAPIALEMEVGSPVKYSLLTFVMAQGFANVNRPPSTLSWPIKSGDAPPRTVLPRPVTFIAVFETPSGNRSLPFRSSHALSSPIDEIVTVCELDREKRIGLLITLVPYEA